MSRMYDSNKDSDVEAQRGSPAKRLCPGANSCWPPLSLMASHFSLLHLPPFAFGRRVSMWLILGLRTSIQILVLLTGHLSPGAWIANVVLGVVSFFVVMYALYCIDVRCVAGGAVRCVGGRWGPMHFGAFCYLAAALTMLLLAGHFSGLGSDVSSGLWLGMWVAIVGVGWVASWRPEGVQEGRD